MKRRLLTIEHLFWFWYVVGLFLLTTIGVPEPLQFANGLFNIFYAAYVIKLHRDCSSSYSLNERVIIAVVMVGLWTWAIEAWGVATGWPFGDYSYTAVLGISVLGVPVSIAAAWIAIIGNGILMADRLLYSSYKKRLQVYGQRSCAFFYLLYRSVIVAALAVTLDLVLDPVAHARRFWEWGPTDHNLSDLLATSGYMGIPWSNFIAWGCIAALLSWLYPIPAPAAERVAATDKSFRLFQAVLLLFGVLGYFENLVLCVLIAIIAILAAEGGIRYARSQEKRML